MYSLSLLIVELETARRRLRNVFEVHRKQQPSSHLKEAITERANGIMIKRWLLHILEHGTVPAVALALAIAPTNSRSWQRHDLTEPTKRVTEILFSAPTTDTMTLAARDHEPVVASTKARPLTAALTVSTIDRTTDHRQTN